MLGFNQPVILQLLEIPQALGALKGVAMELEDCAFPLLHGIEMSDDPKKRFVMSNTPFWWEPNRVAKAWSVKIFSEITLPFL